MLRPPELNFSRLLKNLLDAESFTCLNALVQILERPAQLAAQRPAHTALPGAHKTDQEDHPPPASRCGGLGLGLPAGSGSHACRAPERLFKTPNLIF